MRDWVNYTRSLLLVGGSQVLVAIMQFVRLPILTRGLGPENYGNWTLVWILAALTLPVSMLGLQAAMTRYLASETDKNVIRNNFQGTVAIVFSVSLFIAGAVFLWPDKDLWPAIVIVITQPLIGLANCYLRTFKYIKWYSIGMATRQGIELGLMVLAVNNGYGILGLVTAVAIADLVIVAGVYGFIFKKYGIGTTDISKLGGWLKYGIYTVPSSLVNWTVQSSDKYVLSFMMGDKQVGVYAAAYSLTSVILFMLAPIQSVIFPTVSSEINNDKIKAYFSYTVKLALLLTIPMAFGLWALAPKLLAFFTSTDYLEGAPIIPFVAFGMVFYMVYAVSIYFFYVHGKTYMELILLGITGALKIGLNILLIPYIGIMGCAVSTLVADAFLCVSTVYMCAKWYGFRFDYPFLLKVVISAGAMGLIAWLINPSGWMLFVTIGIGVIVYLIMIWATKAVKISEIKGLLKRD